MTKRARRPEEHMVLLYKRVGRKLYGYIAFYRKEHPKQKIATKPYRESSPFVIGRYLTARDGAAVEYLGSVVFLLGEVRRAIRGFITANNAWNAERSGLIDDADVVDCDAKYEQNAMDFVILVSTHARNLFHLMPRFNDRSIPRLDYHGSRDGQVTLRELFDTLIHHRYYYFDGAQVRDLFSDEFKKRRSALSGRFMGYGFDVFDFVKGISEVIEDVRIKDLTQLVRSQLTRLTADSKPQDVVSLVQNIHAFSDLLQARVPAKGYEFMTKLMFDHLAETKLVADSSRQADGDTTLTQQVIFESPHIGVAPRLDRKEFEIRVRCAVGVPGEVLGRKNLRSHVVTIEFREFLKMVNHAFGNDHVLQEGPKLVPAATRRAISDDAAV